VVYCFDEFVYINERYFIIETETYTFEICFVCEWDTIQDIPKDILAAGPEKNWSAEFVYDIPIGTFTEGTYSYCIEVEWTEPAPGSFVSGWQEFEISEDAPLYEGFVVIRWFEIWARVRDKNGLRCEIIEPIFHPDQPMRFHTGWAIDEEMTRSEAKAHFESLTEKFVFDDGSSFELERSSTIWSELPDVMWEKRKCLWTIR